MRTFDRIVLTMLALGIWALVLTPQEIGAHHQYDDGMRFASRMPLANAWGSLGHNCSVSGTAYGAVDGSDVYVDGSGLSVDCTHY